MTEETITLEVSRFIKKNFLFDEDADLNDQRSLMGTGVVDSTGALELISFLETRFQLEFNDSELVVENFDSVERIKSLIKRKLTEIEPKL